MATISSYLPVKRDMDVCMNKKEINTLKRDKAFLVKRLATLHHFQGEIVSAIINVKCRNTK